MVTMERGIRQRKVVCKCRGCGKLDEFMAPALGFHALSRGRGHEEAFPELDAARIREMREQLCPACQEKLRT